VSRLLLMQHSAAILPPVAVCTGAADTCAHQAHWVDHPACACGTLQHSRVLTCTARATNSNGHAIWTLLHRPVLWCGLPGLCQHTCQAA
jgi:hypothetical protein